MSAKLLPKTKAALLWRLSFRMGSFAKTCLQPLVKRISIKMLENYVPSYILTYSSKHKDLTRNQRLNIHFSSLLVMSQHWWPTKPKYIFCDSYTLCLCWMHWFVSHVIYLSLTKNIMQQYFHPSAKLLLYRQARSQGEHSGAVLPNYIVPRKFCFKHIVKSKILSP